MNTTEREALEAQLTEQLGIKVLIDDYVPVGEIFLFNPPEKDKEPWVVLRAGEAFIMNASKVVRNVIKKKMLLRLRLKL